MFSDWKTTVTGAIGFIAILANYFFKLEIPADVQAAMISATVFIISIFAKDAKTATPKVTP